MYSHFDDSQAEYNLRRRIEVDGEGSYRLRTVMPSGYGCPPDGPTQQLLDLVGRHGNRPAHVHFLVEAPGHRTLTTQINIAGDPLLHDDFAFATRDDLIPDLVRIEDTDRIAQEGLAGPFAEIAFDFTLQRDAAGVPFAATQRSRVNQVAV